MKPCAGNQKLIAWLAANALDAPRAQALRRHLQTCEGCRGYLDEMSAITRNLAAAQPSPEMQASETFHQKLAGTLRATTPNSPWSVASAWLRRWNRLAAPIAMATALVTIALVSGLWRHPAGPGPDLPETGPRPATGLNAELPPTLANYQRAARQSLEKLDELLTEQGNQNPSRTPVYTASMLPHRDAQL